MVAEVHLGANGHAVEGSEATLRMALALSAATGRSFLWSGYRRRKGGFDEIDAELVGLFRGLANGTVEGGEPGDVELRFDPGALASGRVELARDRGVPLLPLLGAVSVPLARAGVETEMTLTGSTHAGGGASFEVAGSSWTHLMRRIGIELEVELLRAGFAPRGGGSLRLLVRARAPLSSFAPLDLRWRGEIESVRIVSAAARLPAHVQQRQAARARSGIQIAGREPSVQLLKLRAENAGSVVAVTGLVDGLPVTVSAVPARSRSAESAGEEAASEFRLLVSTRALVPPVLVDSLLLALAFSEGASTFSTWRLPAEAGAQAGLVRAFAGREVAIEGKAGTPARLRID